VNSTSVQTISEMITNTEAFTIKTIHIKEPYQTILNKFPGITTLKTNMINTPTEHHIITKGPPVHTKTRRLAPDKLDTAKKEFALLQELGICRPSASEWASPVRGLPPIKLLYHPRPVSRTVSSRYNSDPRRKNNLQQD